MDRTIEPHAAARLFSLALIPLFACDLLGFFSGPAVSLNPALAVRYRGLVMAADTEQILQRKAVPCGF
jgi:hypothetical protein